MHRNTEYINIAYNNNNSYFSVIPCVNDPCALSPCLSFMLCFYLTCVSDAFLLSLSNAALISAYILTMI